LHALTRYRVVRRVHANARRLNGQPPSRDQVEIGALEFAERTLAMLVVVGTVISNNNALQSSRAQAVLQVDRAHHRFHGQTSMSNVCTLSDRQVQPDAALIHVGTAFRP
jgi:hypothetical protein